MAYAKSTKVVSSVGREWIPCPRSALDCWPVKGHDGMECPILNRPPCPLQCRVETVVIPGSAMHQSIKAQRGAATKRLAEGCGRRRGREVEHTNTSGGAERQDDHQDRFSQTGPINGDTTAGSYTLSLLFSGSSFSGAASLWWKGVTALLPNHIHPPAKKASDKTGATTLHDLITISCE